MFKRHL